MKISTPAEQPQISTKISSGNIELPESVLRDALDRVVLDSLPLAIKALMLLYSCFMFLHLVVHVRAIAIPMFLVASGSVLALAILLWAFKRRELPLKWAHPYVAVVSLVPLFNSTATLYLLSEPQQTTNLMLVIIAAGLFYLSTRWLAFIIGLTYLCWLAIVFNAAPSPAWLHFGFAMFSATVIAVVIHIVRVRILRRLEGLRIQDELRKAEMLRNERMVAMAQMTTTLMHEINNPLSVILGYSQVLRDQPGIPPDVINRLEKIEKMSLRISEIIKQLDGFEDRLVDVGGVKIIDLHRETRSSEIKN